MLFPECWKFSPILFSFYSHHNSLLGSTFFLYMVHSNNIADFHKQNSVEDTKMGSIQQAYLCTDIFQHKHEESTVKYCFQIHMYLKKFPN